MNRKYFVCSDIHGFYDEWIDSLNKAGFKKEDPSHVLIVLGDIFDRGTQPLEVYKFIRELPRQRRILIRGNHEQLLRELVYRGYSLQHDHHNRTIDTLFQLMGYESYEDFSFQKYLEARQEKAFPGSKEFVDISEKWDKKREQVFNNELIRDVLAWIDSDEWSDYFETGKHIFVHSYIPLRKFVDLPKTYQLGYFVYYKDDEYREDWRNATPTEWDDAKWGCPWKHEQRGLNKTGKTIVCGHWHTSDFFNNLLYKSQKSKQLDIKISNPIFKSDKYPGLIGLDACTALTKVVNVLVLKEECL